MLPAVMSLFSRPAIIRECDYKALVFSLGGLHMSSRRLILKEFYRHDILSEL